MKKLKYNYSIIVFVALLIFSHISIAQNQIPISSINSGGEKIVNTNYSINSSLGTPFIGKSLNVSNHQYSGFWYVYLNDIITSVEDQEIIPTVFKLEQNYPNPFNPSTIIKFGIPERSNVLIKIYDILGSEVITLVNEEMEVGWYKKEFNANGFASGMYIYRMKAGNFVSTKKMLMIK